MNTVPQPQGSRIVAVDALRGLVMMMLVPDLAGGFAFYRMAELHPGSPAWQFLGTQFTHVAWAGAHAWDFVMPVFVLLVGVSMPLSLAARCARGDSTARLLLHAAIRSLALIVLGLLLSMTVRDYGDEVMSFIVIFGLGLPVAAALASWLGARSGAARLAVEAGWALLVLALACTWISIHIERLGAYNLGHIFILLGLAYFPAFLLAGRGTATQLAAAAAVLALFGAAFLLYAPGADPWANGANVAAAVDRALLNRLPRTMPYHDEPHGYHTLQFVPLIAMLLAGTIAGRAMAAATDRRALARRMALWAAVLVVAGLALGASFVPLIKSLWTPSWALFSAGVALLLLAGLYEICDVRGHANWAVPLTVLGSNAVLLYTLAAHDRWRIAGLWRRLIGNLAPADWQPLLEALMVLATLWVLAWILARQRIFIRL